MLKLPRLTKRSKASLANLELEEAGPPVCDVWTVENVRNKELPTSTTITGNYINLETKTTTVAWADTGDTLTLTNFHRRRHFKGESSRD